MLLLHNCTSRPHLIPTAMRATHRPQQRCSLSNTSSLLLLSLNKLRLVLIYHSFRSICTFIRILPGNLIDLVLTYIVLVLRCHWCKLTKSSWWRILHLNYRFVLRYHAVFDCHLSKLAYSLWWLWSLTSIFLGDHTTIYCHLCKFTYSLRRLCDLAFILRNHTIVDCHLRELSDTLWRF